VLLRWETASEVGNAGFRLYRSESEGGQQTELNADLIPSKSDGGPAQYEYLDSSAEPGIAYRYWLVEVSLSGHSVVYGPVAVDAQEVGERIRLFLPLVARGN
jgi:hypothetical protein